MQNLNEIILKAIRQRIPEHILPAHYLMDTLDIAKEPAYRRLRNQVPFTLEEVVCLADNLSVSVDDMLKRPLDSNDAHSDNNLFSELPNDSQIAWVKKFEMALENMKSLKKDTQITVVMNTLPWHFFPLPCLLKHEYNQFMFSHNALPFNVPFSKVEQPSRIVELQQQTIAESAKISQILCCIDRNIIVKTINELKFFHQMGIYSDEDIKQIQQEMVDFLDFMFVTNTRDTPKKELNGHAIHTRFSICICEFSVENNSLFYQSKDGSEMLHVWFYPEMPFIFKNNSAIIECHKRWLASKRKHSTLITNVNAAGMHQFYKYNYDAIKTLLRD